jgi:CRP/FNR family transcriptional regulator, cyclic AMP receptor protein
MDLVSPELIAHPLFVVLSESARREVRRAAARQRAHRAEIIYAPGEPGDTTYLVRRGRVKISRLSSDGREITLCLCHSGELFGEEALVQKAARSCQAQAMEESVLYALPCPLLQQLMREEVAFAMGLARLIGQRREQAEDQVEDLAFRDVGGRLARFLINLASQQGVAMADGRTLLNTRLTHQELANCVGTTRETLTLTIDRFRADGWIRFEGRMIALCDPDALRSRAGDGRPPRDQE